MLEAADPRPCLISTATVGRFCPSFSSPSFLLRKHERQNDVVQHGHPGGLDFKSCFLFPREVVCAMEFSNNHLFLIYGDQLQAGSALLVGWRANLLLGSSSQMHPLPICTDCHLGR